MHLSRTTWAVMLTLSASALAGEPPKTAVDAYMAAAALCVTPSVAEGTDESLDIDHPPYSAKWIDAMRAVRAKNTAGLATARQAGRLPAGAWEVPPDLRSPDWPQLGRARHLACQLADAATLARVEGRPAAALDLLDDMAALVDTLESSPREPGGDLRSIVATGVDAYRCTALIQAAPYLTLGTHDAEGVVTPRRLRAIVRDLLDQRTPAERIEAFGGFALDMPYWVYNPPVSAERAQAMATESFNRRNAERTLAAMSLACQLYRSDHGTWPDDAEQLVPQYLPVLPADPWGDGKQTFGYRLIKAGLPDGGDRPLVFDRCVCGSKRLFTDQRQPLYGWTNCDGIDLPGDHRDGGQFRDVAAWPVKP